MFVFYFYRKAIWTGKKDDNNEENRRCNNFSVLYNDIVMHGLCKESSTPHVFCQIDNSNENCIGIDISIDMFDLYIYDISKESDKNTISSNIYDALSRGQSLNPPEKEFGFDSDDSQNGTIIHSGNLNRFDQIVNNNGNNNGSITNNTNNDDKMNDLMAHLDSILKVPTEFEKENTDVNVNIIMNQKMNGNINGYFDNLANDLQEMTQYDDNWIPPSAINTNDNMKEDNSDDNDMNDYLVDLKMIFKTYLMTWVIMVLVLVHLMMKQLTNFLILMLTGKNCLTNLNAKDANIHNDDEKYDMYNVLYCIFWCVLSVYDSDDC